MQTLKTLSVMLSILIGCAVLAVLFDRALDIEFPAPSKIHVRQH